MKRTPLKRKTPLARGTKGLKRTRLARVSRKRRLEDAEYLRLRGVFLEHNPYCRVCENFVTSFDVRFSQSGAVARILPATDVHHKAGRGRFYLRVDTWLPVCRDHHERITESRQWAEERGYSLTVAQRRALP